MKKLLFLLIGALLFSSPAFAARVVTNYIITATTLDADPTAVSGTARLTSAEKTAFLVRYDETEVGGISVAITVQISDDNTTWIASSFHDFAGGATLQTSETLTADGNYYLWLSPDITAPYVKLIVTATGSDADDTAVVSARIITQE